MNYVGKLSLCFIKFIILVLLICLSTTIMNLLDKDVDAHARCQYFQKEEWTCGSHIYSSTGVGSILLLLCSNVLPSSVLLTITYTCFLCANLSEILMFNKKYIFCLF